MKNSIYIILFLCFVGCYGEEEVTEELIELTVAWTAEGCGGGNRRLAMDTVNGVVYLTEVAEESLCAIDLNTGELLWRTDEEERFFSKVNPVYDDKFVYGIGRAERKNVLSFLKLDKMTGEVVTKREIGEGWELFPRMYSLTLYEGVLYWGAKDSHFVYSLDTANEESVPEICYGSADETADILGDIVPYQGRLYFGHEYYPCNDPVPSYIVSLDPNDKENFLRKEIPPGFYLVAENDLQFYQEKLYCKSMGVKCLEPETLETIWEIDCLGNFCGFLIHEDRIYSTQSADFIEGVICLDIKKRGKQLWKTDLDSGFYGTIAYTPQVYEGYLYLPTQASVIVLDADTGKFVGRDESLQTGFLSMGITERYNDLMIFETMYDRIYAVKMDLHERQLGGKE